MGISRNGHQVGYGLTNSLQNLSPEPIVASRSPQSSDQAIPGTLWINKLTQSTFVCSGTANGVTYWDGIANAPITVNVDNASTTTLNGVNIFAGAGAPTFAAPQGSLYLRTDGSSSSTRAYICSVSSGTWVAVTTAS